MKQEPNKRTTANAAEPAWLTAGRSAKKPTRDTLMKSDDWKKSIPGSFGMVDLHFASHPLDAKRAKTMMKSALEAGASIDKIMDALVAYMKEKGCGEAHIQTQLGHARKLEIWA